MIRYNPCGRVVDISRRAYSRPCRFFKDSEVISRVKWMDARPDAPVLGRTSVILSKYLEPDDWLEGGVGEVAGSARTTTLAKAPAGLPYTHVCGTDEDFDEGGTRDEDLPEVEYAANGLPKCCDPPFLVRGGAGSGAHVRLVAPVQGGPDCLHATTLLPGVDYLLATSTPAGGLSFFRIQGVPAPTPVRVTCSWPGAPGQMTWSITVGCPAIFFEVSTNIQNSFVLANIGFKFLDITSGTAGFVCSFRYDPEP